MVAIGYVKIPAELPDGRDGERGLFMLSAELDATARLCFHRYLDDNDALDTSNYE